MNNNGEFESGEVFVYTKDHLGSIRELSDMQQKPIQRYNYTSYGLTSLEKTTADSEVFVTNPYAYTARELDESGDYFYRARYYDAKSGRFLSQDPIGFAGGDESLYRYVRNDPVSWVDPSGLVALDCGYLNREQTSEEEVYNYRMSQDKPLESTYPELWLGFGAAIVKGPEFTIRGIRVAPLGNRTKNPTGELPHYHRKALDPKTGKVKEGGSIKRHRPWDSRSTDKSFWDRF